MQGYPRLSIVAVMFAILLTIGPASAQEKPAPKENPPPAPVAPPAENPAPKAPAPAAPQETPKPVTRDEIVAQDVEKAVKLLGSENYLESEEAKTSIMELGTKSLPHLIKTLEQGNAESKFLICEILGNLRNGAAVSALIKMLSQNDAFGTSLAAASARALGRIGDERAIPELKKVLESDRAKTDIELRYEAIRALGALRATDSEELLKKFLDDRVATMNNRIVACAAIEALGKIRAKASMTDIAKKLTDKTPESWSGKTIEIYAAKALEAITGVVRGPIWEPNDQKTIETLKQWNDWWTEETKKKTPEKPAEPPKDPKATDEKLPAPPEKKAEPPTPLPQEKTEPPTPPPHGK